MPRPSPRGTTGRRSREAADGVGIGPGIVAGASDNDPTTVATLAVIGSTVRYDLAWLTLLVIPMLAVVQAIAAQVGAASRGGLEDAIRRRYGKAWAALALATLAIVNLLTLAADLEGGAAALGLLTRTSYLWWLVPFALVTTLMLVFGSFRQIERVLRYLALLFLTYVVAAFLARPAWGDVLAGSLVPHFAFDGPHVSGALALLGTTLTAYAYVWETVEVGEERPAPARLGLVQVDAALGIVVAGLSFWFIEIATGATLGVHHHVVETTEDAAAALAPLAGPYASIVFGLGLLGSALIAVPVIAATTAYVTAEMFGWRESLDASFATAPAFYRTLIGAMLVALGIAFAGVKPIALLYLSGIAGGIATPFTLVLMLLIARDRAVMASQRIPGTLAVGGWLVTAVVSSASIVFLVQTLRGGS